MKPFIQLTKAETVSFLTPAAIARLKKHFDTHHFIKLPQFIEPSLLAYTLGQLQQADFFKVTFKGIGEELNMKPNVMDSMFLFFLNDPKLLKLIEKIEEMQKRAVGARLAMTSDVPLRN